MRLAGFRSESAAFFSWLGVTPYLNRETVVSTLRLIISMSNENGVVFDYAVPLASLGMLCRIAFALARSVAAAGEPFQCFFDPGELGHELREVGFRQVEDLDGKQINGILPTGPTDCALVG